MSYKRASFYQIRNTVDPNSLGQWASQNFTRSHTVRVNPREDGIRDPIPPTGASGALGTRREGRAPPARAGPGLTPQHALPLRAHRRAGRGGWCRRPRSRAVSFPVCRPNGGGDGAGSLKRSRRKPARPRLRAPSGPSPRIARHRLPARPGARGARCRRPRGPANFPVDSFKPGRGAPDGRSAAAGGPRGEPAPTCPAQVRPGRPRGGRGGTHIARPMSSRPEGAGHFPGGRAPAPQETTRQLGLD